MTGIARSDALGGTIDTRTRYGRVRGRIEDGIAKFLGIPYGAPPLGALRFKAPRPPSSWSGVRDTLAFAAPAFQAPGHEMGPTGNGRMPTPSEDCLYLNVWTPAPDGKRRPVMFYNHGGGFMIGSGAATGQDGTNLARLHDVVVVESNHRLGLLGYLFLGDLAGGDYAANQGMLDILAALHWVAENIENFGGDPDNVMVWGESGGGAKTAAVYTMPDAATLFHKASIESASLLRFATREGATERARRTLQLLGVSDVAALHDAPTTKLLEVQSLATEVPRGIAPWNNPDPVPGFGAFVDGTIITQHPFADGVAPFSAAKPLMCGTCRDEMVFFSLFGSREIFGIDEAGLRSELAAAFPERDIAGMIDAFRRSRPGASPAQLYFAITSSPIWRDSIKTAEAKLAQNAAPVFMYQLAYQSPSLVPGTNFPLGAPHAADITMKFANAHMDLDILPYPDRSPERLATARHMSGLWAGFARDGVPSAPDVPNWPSYSLARRPTMWIDAEPKVVDDLDRTERLYWEGAT